MKKDIHPEARPTIFVDTSCGAEFVTTSTLHSDETKDKDGVTYQVVRVEISSGSHPFYTGKQIFIDAARRVEKFEEKMTQVKAAADARKGKKVKRAVRATKKTPKTEA